MANFQINEGVGITADLQLCMENDGESMHTTIERLQAKKFQVLFWIMYFLCKLKAIYKYSVISDQKFDKKKRLQCFYLNP